MFKRFFFETLDKRDGSPPTPDKGCNNLTNTPGNSNSNSSGWCVVEGLSGESDLFETACADLRGRLLPPTVTNVKAAVLSAGGPVPKAVMSAGWRRSEFHPLAALLTNGDRDRDTGGVEDPSQSEAQLLVDCGRFNEVVRVYATLAVRLDLGRVGGGRGASAVGAVRSLSLMRSLLLTGLEVSYRASAKTLPNPSTIRLIAPNLHLY